MFDKIFVEEEIKNLPSTQKILNIFKNAEHHFILDHEQFFGKVKKPYLQKRDSLNLFLAQKKGSLVKVAPNAYGLSGDPHYYFIHSYNCIYECDYCYLQGYFHSPDIVLFLNHKEIGEKILEISNQHQDSTPWFHAGEYSDSLALSHFSSELNFYFDLFKKIPHAKLELRTKSINIKELITFEPLPNIITSFSLSSKERAKANDLKTPPLESRLQAIAKLHQLGFKIAIHFDPIIYSDNLLNEYEELICSLEKAIPMNEIQYLSLGVVRFTKDVYHQILKNYPQSNLLGQEFIKSFDNKIRYSKPMRMWMMSKIKDLLIKKGLANDRIYLCMEEE